MRWLSITLIKSGKEEMVIEKSGFLRSCTITASGCTQGAIINWHLYCLSRTNFYQQIFDFQHLENHSFTTHDVFTALFTQTVFDQYFYATMKVYTLTM